MRISYWSSDVCSSDLDSRDRLARRVECTLNGRFRRLKNGSSGYLPVESGTRWGTSGRLCICHSHDSADRHRTFPCDECWHEERSDPGHGFHVVCGCACCWPWGVSKWVKEQRPE